MKKKHQLAMSRRSFLKTAGATGAVLSFSSPARLFAGTGLTEAVVRNDFNVSANPASATNLYASLLNFAQVSDVHITDTTNPLRAGALDAVTSAALRPQEHLSAATWDAVVRSINTQIESKKLAFMMSTGDQIDNALEHEIEWFLNVVDGNAFSGYYNDLVGTTPNEQSDVPVPAVSPAGLGMPWYLAVGNHDVMIVGNFNAKFVEAFLKLIIEAFQKNPEKYPQWQFNITDLQEVIAKIKTSTTQDDLHGLGYMPLNEDGLGDGYYSFSPNKFMHCIVLNTTNDNWLEGASDKTGKSLTDQYLAENQAKIETMLSQPKSVSADPQQQIDQLIKEGFNDFAEWANQKAPEYLDMQKTKGFFDWNDGIFGGIAQGTLDKVQYEWMKKEIDDNKHRLCLIFSHHGPDSFLTPLGNISANDFIETLQGYPNVIAHIHGHTHFNLIKPSYDVETLDVGAIQQNGNYWDITTNSIAEWPMQWRRIAVVDNGDGTGRISCRMHNHTYQAGLDAAQGDTQAQPDFDTMVGSDQDCDVDLLFAMPVAVAGNITGNAAEIEEGGVTAEDIQNNNAAAFLLNDSDDQRCFVATAAFGSSMQPEVASLRLYRDNVLRQNPVGRLFISTYYRLSPPAARFIAGRPALKAVTRQVLKPIIALVKSRHTI